jgi:hypothetical protein
VLVVLVAGELEQPRRAVSLVRQLLLRAATSARATVVQDRMRPFQHRSAPDWHRARPGRKRNANTVGLTCWSCRSGRFGAAAAAAGGNKREGDGGAGQDAAKKPAPTFSFGGVVAARSSSCRTKETARRGCSSSSSAAKERRGGRKRGCCLDDPSNQHHQHRRRSLFDSRQTSLWSPGSQPAAPNENVGAGADAPGAAVVVAPPPPNRPPPVAGAADPNRFSFGQPAGPSPHLAQLGLSQRGLEH